MNQLLSINQSDLGNLFPFFILVDEKLDVISCGQSIEKLLPSLLGNNLNNCFIVERPHFGFMSFENLKLLNGQLIVFASKQEASVNLRVQPQYFESENKVLIVGSPWFDSVDTLSESGLKINDFPAYSPQIDLLHILSSQEIVNQELKELLEKTAKQKNELKSANDKIKLITQDLEIANNRFEYAINASNEAIIDWDLTTNKVYYGNEWAKIFGQLNTNDENTIQSNIDRIHPEDIERIKARIKEIVKSEHSQWNEEFRYLKSNGQYASVSNRSAIVRDNNGKALRIIGLLKDVTQLRKEEVHLRLLESVIKYTNDAVIITEASPKKPIVFVNDAFTKITGYTINDVIGKNPKIFQGPNSSNESLQKIKNTLDTFSHCEVNTINYKKNGEEYWVSISLSPIKDNEGNYTHWIAIERDITEQKNAEAEIITQKKFTEDILNTMPADVAVFDGNHRYLFVNPHAIKNDELRNWMIGKNDFDYAKLKGIDDSLARKRREIFDHTVKSATTFEWIDKHSGKDGDNYILRKFYPYFEKNKLKFVIGYGIDITERKNIEIELGNALEDVQKSNAELEQFAYVASHDLQEPLRMVTSFLSQLEKKYADNLDARAKEYIFYAVDGAKRMRQIILDLLEFSRIGKTEERQMDINLNEIIQEIKILHSKQIEELHAEINFHELPNIISFKTPLRQVFQNLIGNALKYSKKDIPPIVDIKYEKQDNKWLFSVSDNGIGIDNPFHDKIFAIFQRLHNKEEYSGTGIGLAITKKIIETMGGKIWIESEINKGSTFYFTIPF
jgi:PAS domain S-box-containing protein